MMTAVDKPEFLDFEDHKGVLPVHTVGLWLTGQVPVGSSRFGYMAWTGNGDRMVANGNVATLDPNNYNDDNRTLTVGARVLWSFGAALQGLSAGLTGMTQKIDYSPDPTATTPNVANAFQSTFVTGVAHVVYEAHGVELVNELHVFQNSATLVDGSSQSSVRSWAAYSQLAYWIKGVFAPYARVERAHFDQKDVFFAAQINGVPYWKAAVGARYNLTERFAVKVEISHKDILTGSANVATGTIDTGRLQLAARF
jgi:hypothetical protein